MTTSENTNRTCFGRQIIIGVIIACLCYSSGEGLRLRPFPVIGLETAQTRNVPHGDGSTDISTNHHRYSLVNKYNPAVSPARQLKRGKQQEIEWNHGSPSAESNRELSAYLVILATAGLANDSVSVVLALPLPGRSPPFIS